MNVQSYQYKGYKIEIIGGISYCCSRLKLRGYASTLQIERAVNKKINAIGKKTT